MPSPLPFLPFPAARGGVKNDAGQGDIGPGYLWQAENYVLEDGLFRTRRGLAPLGTAQSKRIQGITVHETAGADRTLPYATLDGLKVYVGDGSDDLDLNVTLSGSAEDSAIFRTFIKSDTNYLLMTNGKDNLQKWDGDQTHDAADASGSPPVMRSMVIVNNRLLAINLVGDHPNAVDCCDFLDFESGWGNNRVLLADMPGPLVGGMEMGNLRAAIYGTNAVYMAQAAGATDIFSTPFTYQLAWPMPNAGPVSPRAIVGLPGGQHAFVGLDGAIYIFDGVSATPLGSHIQKFLVASADFNLASLFHAFFDAEQRNLYVYYPEIGQSDCNAGIAVKIPEGTLWPLRMLKPGAADTGTYVTAGIKAPVPTPTLIGDVPTDIGDTPGTLGDYTTVKHDIVLATTKGDAIQPFKQYGTTWTATGTGNNLDATKVNDLDFETVAWQTLSDGLSVDFVTTLHYDHGSDAPHFVGVLLWGNHFANLVQVQVQTSDDDASWTNVATVVPATDLQSDGLHFRTEWADPGAHRYWQFIFSMNATITDSALWYELQFLEDTWAAVLQSQTEETDADSFFETALVPAAPGLVLTTAQQIEHFFDGAQGTDVVVKLGGGDYGFERELGDPDTATLTPGAPTITEHDSSSHRFFCFRLDASATPQRKRSLTWRGSVIHYAQRGPA